MARVSTYLNFNGQTEEAFLFYKSVFGTEFQDQIMYMKDVPLIEGMPPLSEDDAKKVMHVSLPILAGHVIMGTDAIESMGQKLLKGNNMSINLEPDSRAEGQRLFEALSQGGHYRDVTAKNVLG